MNHFERGVMEKHAKVLGKVKDWFTSLSPVQRYKKIKESPSFKIKKTIGKGIIGGGALTWGISRATTDPKLVSNTVPGIAPRMQ